MTHTVSVQFHVQLPEFEVIIFFNINAAGWVETEWTHGRLRHLSTHHRSDSHATLAECIWPYCNFKILNDVSSIEYEATGTV